MRNTNFLTFPDESSPILLIIPNNATNLFQRTLGLTSIFNIAHQGLILVRDQLNYPPEAIAHTNRFHPRRLSSFYAYIFSTMLLHISHNAKTVTSTLPKSIMKSLLNSIPQNCAIFMLYFSITSAFPWLSSSQLCRERRTRVAVHTLDVRECLLGRRDQAGPSLLHSPLVFMFLVEAFVVTRVPTTGLSSQHRSWLRMLTMKNVSSP